MGGVNVSATGGEDIKAKVSANDTTAGYLNGKLIAGANVSLTENNDGSDETLTVAAGAGASITVEEDNVPLGSAASLDFLGQDFDLSLAAGEAEISIASAHTGSAHHARAHNMDGASDHNAGTLGDTLYGGVAGAWTKLAGNTTATRKFLRQVGDGVNSAAPAWDTLQTGDVPDLSGTYAIAAKGVTNGDSHDHNGGDGASIPDAALASGATVVSAGAGDSGKLVKLDAAGHVDASAINDADIDHANLSNVTADQHHARSHAINSSSDHTVSGGTDGYVLRETGATSFAWEADYYCLEIHIDARPDVISTGVMGYVEVPSDGVIERATLLADQTGSIVIDIWKDTYANFPPTDADSITSATPPTLSSAQKSQDTTLSGWTTSVTAGDILAFNVDSASTVTYVVLSLRVRKT